MAIPDEFPDDEEPDGLSDEVDAEATPTVASANDTTASTMTTGLFATQAATAADTAATETAATAEGQRDVAGTTVYHLNAASAVHDLESEEYASGDQQHLTSIENSDAGPQQLSIEPRESPVEQASAAVVPTPVTAIPELNRIRDGASGITARVNNDSLLSSSLSSASGDYESSSSEEDAADGATKRNYGRSVKKNLSTDQLSSGNQGKSVDVFSVICSICNDRFWDSACLPCGHLGCRHCIDEWLQLSIPPRSCHICRRNVQSVKTPVVLCDFSCEPCFTN